MVDTVLVGHQYGIAFRRFDCYECFRACGILFLAEFVTGIISNTPSHVTLWEKYWIDISFCTWVLPFSCGVDILWCFVLALAPPSSHLTSTRLIHCYTYIPLFLTCDLFFLGFALVMIAVRCAIRVDFPFLC
ncbi:hypothetical protein BDV59DRAFT_88264 [Aspergillus ambiguus]|uniref:uncharacterized protein n=1 Tax=Aspergillus ambiguus TaxID=176160 RepID=UPI003CCD5FBD